MANRWIMQNQRKTQFLLRTWTWTFIRLKECINIIRIIIIIIMIMLMLIRTRCNMCVLVPLEIDNKLQVGSRRRPLRFVWTFLDGFNDRCATGAKLIIKLPLIVFFFLLLLLLWLVQWSKWSQHHNRSSSTPPLAWSLASDHKINRSIYSFFSVFRFIFFVFVICNHRWPLSPRRASPHICLYA